MTIIRPCTCKDEFQDKTYGSSMRVWNYHPTLRSSMIKCKCTVCGKKEEIRNLNL